MVLFSFHYAVTSFFLATWWHSVWWVLVVHFVFQAIFFAIGANVAAGQEALFWGWQALVTALGALAGLHVGNTPILLVLNGYSWAYFVLSLAAFLGAQLFYAFYPPLNTVPAGQAGVGLAVTFILTVIIILATWYGNSREKEPWGYYLHWACLFGLLEFLFYITLSGLAEVWVALIATGSTLLIAFCSFHLWYKHRPVVRYGVMRYVRRNVGTSI